IRVPYQDGEPSSTGRSRKFGTFLHAPASSWWRSTAGRKSSEGTPLGDEARPGSLMMDRQGRVGRKEPRRPAQGHRTPSEALPQRDPSGLGGMRAQTTPSMKFLSFMAPGVEVKWVLPRSQESLGNLSEKVQREEEEEEAAGAPDRIRGHFAQALEVEQGATGPLEVSPEALAVEEQQLQDGDPRPASLKVGATPWNHILTLYKQFQKLAMAKLPLEEDSHDEEEGEEEEMEEEDSSFKLCVPVPLQSPLHKTFRPIDTVGFVESELKKFLEAQQESRLRLRKMRSLEGLEPLVPSEITLESILGDQGLLLQEMDALGNWPPH
uniref:Ubiquitin-like domain-containing protein n=1 Tax=Myotis lucifugus TaxID=59463 RepID=G1NUG5_MYOLU